MYMQVYAYLVVISYFLFLLFIAAMAQLFVQYSRHVLDICIGLCHPLIVPCVQLGQRTLQPNKMNFHTSVIQSLSTYTVLPPSLPCQLVAVTHLSASPHSKKKTPRHEKHDRALKKVMELKNKARKELRQAKQEGKTGEVILSLARNFFTLVRKQSQLKKKSRKSSEASSAKKTRQRCHKNF